MELSHVNLYQTPLTHHSYTSRFLLRKFFERTLPLSVTSSTSPYPIRLRVNTKQTKPKFLPVLNLYVLRLPFLVHLLLYNFCFLLVSFQLSHSGGVWYTKVTILYRFRLSGCLYLSFNYHGSRPRPLLPQLHYFSLTIIYVKNLPPLTFKRLYIISLPTC